MPLAYSKQPGTSAFKRLFAAAATAACLSAASAQTSVNATVYGVGADYFAQDLHSFVCQVVPTDGTPSFYTACSRDQAHDLGGGEPVTLELQDNTQAADLNLAAQEEALGIVRPVTQIGKATGGRRRARRRVLDGPRSILIMIINYADVQVDYTDEAGARRMMHNPDGQDVDGLYRSSSYNRLSFPNELVTVITINSPIRLNDESTECTYVEWSEDTDDLIADQHPTINPADFMHKVYLLPTGVPACSWGGVAFVDTCNAQQNGGTARPHCKAWVRGSSPTILAHELGHNLGTIHAADDWDDDGVQALEYGDFGCIMGSAEWASMNAPHRALLGYLGEGNGIETHDTHCAVNSPSEISLTISRLDLAPGNNPYPNMIRVARYPAKDYLLSFKAPGDWDGTSVADNYRNRLQIHVHDGSRVNTLIVRMLFVGETFTGETMRDGNPVPLTITVTRINANDITFTINTGCGTNRPTQFGETRAPTVAPTGPQMLQGDITCGQIVTGTTERPGTSSIGNDAPDHIWHFTLAQATEVTFDGCNSSFDTWIRIWDRDLTEEYAEGDDSSSCPYTTRSRLAYTLAAGDYSVIMEGYGNEAGTYIMEMSMAMGCPTTDRPTSSPAAIPTITGVGCHDNHQYCPVWARQGHCSGDHSNYMTAECPGSCFRCPDQRYGTPPVNPDMPVEDPPSSPPPTSPPTDPPTSPQCHIAECGKVGGCGSSFEATCDIHSAQHEVRCCSSIAKSGWRTWAFNRVEACTNVWGASFDQQLQFECSEDKTFHEAEAICAGVGARLCTVAELINDCTRGTGCGYDRTVVWSSDTSPGVAFAADLGNRYELPYTSTEEPSTTTSEQEQNEPSNSLTATTSNDDSSNGGTIAAAIFGTLAVVAVLAAILYVRQQGQKTQQIDYDDYGAPEAASRRISLRRNADVEDPANFAPLTVEMPTYPDVLVDSPSRNNSAQDMQPIPRGKEALDKESLDSGVEDAFAVASNGRSVRREEIKTLYVDGLDDLKIVGATAHRRDNVKTVFEPEFVHQGQADEPPSSPGTGNIELLECIARRSRPSVDPDGRNRSDSYSLSIRPPSPPSFPAEAPAEVQGRTSLSKLVPPAYQTPPE